MKNNNYIKGLGLLAFSLLYTTAGAREIQNLQPFKPNGNDRNFDNVSRFANNCKPASQSADLDINNVRTKILNGGDMWWDLSNPKYEIPKVIDANSVRKHSLFAGALWIGGTAGAGQIKLAAMTYRQRGSDFWPGPLDTTVAGTDANRCDAYNKVWKITREELLTAEQSNWTDISANILDWPAGPNRPQRQDFNEPNFLAPFFNADGSPFYDPTQGDYPILDPLRPNTINKPKDQPDQMVWFVYNDRGNVHTESNGVPIGLELQTAGFAFRTNDEINNMTFYTTTIINRGFEKLSNTYFGQWVDADLGNYTDDFVGCDVGRSLGFCYNGDDFDEGPLGYGLNPPSVGVDFFEGPKDSAGNELGMSSFVYYNNNSNPINGNPFRTIDFYNYLQGRFMNGERMKFGKDGVQGTDECSYMFSDGTDPAFPGQNWTERSAGNAPADRRFLQNSGPFTLLPGAVNRVTVGVVWAKTNSGGAEGSLGLLKKASDKAQKLFNNKFKITDGPDAPVVEVQELENELVIKLLNTDRVEKYSESVVNELGDTLVYKFQGYMIYQLSDGTVSTSDLNNIDKARLVFQCDVQDNISQIINLEYDPTVNANIPVEKVNGANKGISHTLSVKEDVFASGSNKSVINFRTYYFMVVSYGYLSNDTLKTDPQQFLAGRNNIKVFGVPHKSEPRNGGSQLGADYGSGPKIRRLEGRGNGGNVLEFTKETIEEILANGRSDNPVYLGGNGPVSIKVIDPFKVPKAEFELVFVENVVLPNKGAGNNQYLDSISANTSWILINKTTGDSVYSDTTMQYKYESIQGRNSTGKQLTANSLADWGLSITVEQVGSPGNNRVADPTNGVLSYEVIWEDPSKQWLDAIPDIDGNPSFNWIRSGTQGTNSATANNMTDDFGYITASARLPYDPNEAFEKIWDRRIAPYALCSREPFNASTGQNTFGPAWSKSIFNVAPGSTPDNPLSELASIDLVITPDRSKWTQCVVLELGEEKVNTQGNMEKMNMRYAPSKDVNGNEIGGELGRSYFPGYAINVETGERLNIMFGEDSYLTGQNGSDMIWNPTSVYNAGTGAYPAFGGKHYIYIMGSYVGLPNRSYRGPIYDNGSEYASKLAVSGPNTSPSDINKRQVFSQCMWVIPAMLAQGYDMKNGVPPTTVTIKIRMKKSYTRYITSSTPSGEQGTPRYSFNTNDIAVDVSSEHGKKSVELINIVPNPYYAYSKYETSPLDNKVKITNLPPKATISIYTMNGTLIRRIKKDDDLTYIDWDLKNGSKVPIASGMYIIHVDCGELGEKILKWFGVMRTVDLDSY